MAKLKQRVVLRGSAKGQRRRRFLGVLSVILFSVWGIFLAQDRHSKSVVESYLGRVKAFLAKSATLHHVEVSGVPDIIKVRLLNVAAIKLGEPLGFWKERALVSKLRKELECLKSVEVHRNWFQGKMIISASLKSPIGHVESEPELYLSREGQLFHGPKNIFPQDSLLALDLKSREPESLRRLASWLEEISQKRSAFPAPPRRIAYRSVEDGAELTLTDGTKILWGNFSRLNEKLVRLKQVWKDAREKFSGILVADLRYFEEGKVLVRQEGRVHGQI
ncbi:MAG: cell division protein FtsQ [Elusimicrobia bacterium]|nr:cell division protein FtsQ [Elusimicrobiota bacterium]